jgi:hypothetical protein
LGFCTWKEWRPFNTSGVEGYRYFVKRSGRADLSCGEFANGY